MKPIINLEKVIDDLVIYKTSARRIYDHSSNKTTDLNSSAKPLLKMFLCVCVKKVTTTPTANTIISNILYGRESGNVFNGDILCA